MGCHGRSNNIGQRLLQSDIDGAVVRRREDCEGTSARQSQCAAGLESPDDIRKNATGSESLAPAERQFIHIAEY